MIDYIKGKLVERRISSVIVEVNNGIGYSLNVSTQTASSLSENAKEVKLFISESSSMYSGTSTWYGFLSEEERELFEIIKSVDKIGAKGALDILSRISNNMLEFKNIILNQDLEKLHIVFGFTQKKAEKLILGLKNKISGINVSDDLSQNICSSITSHENDAIEALKTLGYNAVSAKKIIADVLKKCDKNQNLSLEDIIKLALKAIA